jgi:hypothetical protein
VNPFLTFICFIGGMILVGLIVKKVTGVTTKFIETFPLEAGEHVVWEDRLANGYAVASLRAKYTTHFASKRRAVRVTNLRIISGTRGLFGPKHVIENVLYPSDRRYPEEANSLTGGFFKYGYKVLVFQRSTAQQFSAEKYPHVELTLDQTIGSSANLDKFRIYTETLATFRLPD